MSEGNGIVRNNDGTFTPIVNGRPVGGGPFTSQTDAENAYNANGGAANFGDPSGGNPGGGGQTGFNYPAADIAERQVKDAGDLAYNYARLRGYDFVIAEAARTNAETARRQEIWNETQGAAQLSGTFNGAPTLAARNQAEQLGVQEGGLLGLYKGQQTLAAKGQEQQFGLNVGALTGLYNGAPTLAAQGQQQNTANQYLTLLSQLQGPANAFQYVRTLNGTPQGIRDIVGAAAGRYQLSNFGGTSGEQPVRASLGGLIDSATSGRMPGANMPLYGTAAADQATNQNYGVLPAPHQISPQAWNNYSPSQKQLLLAAYRDQGYDPADVQAQFEASLPTASAVPKFGSAGMF